MTTYSNLNLKNNQDNKMMKKQFIHNHLQLKQLKVKQLKVKQLKVKQLKVKQLKVKQLIQLND